MGYPMPDLHNNSRPFLKLQDMIRSADNSERAPSQPGSNGASHQTSGPKVTSSQQSRTRANSENNASSNLVGKLQSLSLMMQISPMPLKLSCLARCGIAVKICMSTERVIVQESIGEQFTEALVQWIEKVTYGSHQDDASFLMSGLFSPASATRIISLIQEATTQGANLLTGDLKIAGAASTILRPHVLSSVTPEMSIFHSETLGPVVCVAACKTDAEAIDLANATDFSLAAAVFSKDIMRALEVTRQVRSGSCHINGPTVYIEAPLPNGGTGGSSGYGQFGGVAGIEAFTEKKIVTLAEKGMKYPMFM